jgi:hypothetical protein
MEREILDREQITRSLASAAALIERARERAPKQRGDAQEEARRALEGVRLHLKPVLIALAPNNGELWRVLFSGAEQELVLSGSHLGVAASRYDYVREALAIALNPAIVDMDSE